MAKCQAKGENYSHDFAASLQNGGRQSILNIRKEI